MRLGDLLLTILDEQGIVVIPRFGTVVKSRMSACINGGSISPPFFEIAFNCNNPIDDGVVVSNWARVKRVSYNDARTDISKQVEELNRALFVKKKVLLPGFGTFSVTKDNKIEFAIDDSASIDDILKNKPIAISLAGQKDNKQIVEEEIKKEEKVNPKKRKGISAFAVIMIIIVLLVGAWFAIPDETRSSFVKTLTTYNTHSGSGVVQNTKEDEEVAVAPQIPSDNNSETKGNTADDLSPDEGEMFTLDMTSCKYFVIAGQFSMRANAEKLYWELKDKGYSPVFVGRRGGLYHVAIGAYNSRFSADSLELTLRVSEDIRGCWVLDVNE
ncbi:MAG: SPOR domain-containing protein [Bacteroidales bacterium]